MTDTELPPVPAAPEAPPAPPPPEVDVTAAPPPPPAAVKKPRGRPRGPAKRTVKTAKVMVTTRFNMFIHTQDVMVIPGRTPTVELDHLVQAQLDAGLLKVV